ncbi:MAG: TetR/AcrR family transcriptional regulator [Cellulophaga sp.]|uniref:TetR/AcrR family transcriptional regulator n=1 Tax=unclassified Cellulophaga TaxID=2634405 RepID=UPI000C2BDF1A|nr:MULTISPECIES: TetR/AcrR family transcriptional regulator [unclassified Cellulophaga]MDO6493075.1 TetR/AcrR family transcriptional regulator [Cellulophaga sp. 2_MG-2023]MDO6496480.1 TetR/AcrR family transcriptional regulator [Cellulophaga sp. 3_MG-2023]PKB43899.1 TetR family transcriptional regulator [Cellulophaga sp. RHA19]
MKRITKKELFFEKTLKLISEKGFKATTMRDIAHELNFEVANVYNYIDSKEALLEDYIFSTLEEFVVYLDNIMNSSYSPVEKLKFVISKHVQYTLNKPYEVSLFVYEWRSLKDEKLEDFKVKRSGYISTVSNIIEEGIAEGSLRKMDSEFSTFMVISSMRWLFSMITNDDIKVNPIEIEKQLTDFIFKGIENK